MKCNRLCVDPMMDLFSEPENLCEIGFFLDVSASEKHGGFGRNFTRQMVKGIGV